VSYAKNGRTVKGVNTQTLQDTGDPVEMAEILFKKIPDELVFKIFLPQRKQSNLARFG
jgi:imidazole glycerol phosphate synthase subunit HisF